MSSWSATSAGCSRSPSPPGSSSPPSPCTGGTTRGGRPRPGRTDAVLRWIHGQSGVPCLAHAVPRKGRATEGGDQRPGDDSRGQVVLDWLVRLVHQRQDVGDGRRQAGLGADRHEPDRGRQQGSGALTPRGALILAVAAAACGRDGARMEPAAGAPYCRRAGAVTALPAAGLAGSLGAAMRESTLRPLHTFSIVARDPATGDLGVAVQSHWFAVGSLVTWAEPGVGAIATQSFVEPSYGPLGLALLRDGVAAPDALAKLVAADAGRDVRQVAVVDAAGRVGVHTGAKCIEHAGHATGAGYSVQANMMGTDQVVPAMARAYEAARGDL